MIKKGILVFFFILLLINIIGGETGTGLLQYVSKPLLMPVLAFYFLLYQKGFDSALTKWVLLALFFSWAGDVLLLFQERTADFFLFGLSAFLLAHVCYIFLFHNIRAREGMKINYILALPVAAYYGILIKILSPHLGDMQMPVIIYGLIISFMLILALQMRHSWNKEAGKWMAAGAMLFILSDSLLAFNKFYKPFKLADIAVMLTYGFAQFLIVSGVAMYIRRTKK